MNGKQNTPIANEGKDAKKEPYVQRPDEVSQNPNPRANENIRAQSEEASAQDKESTQGVGSEITDGEDA